MNKFQMSAISSLVRVLVLAVLVASMAVAQLTVSGNGFFVPEGGYGGFIISDASGAHVKFQYASTQGPASPVVPSPFIFVPASGVTPATVYVALNPAVTSQYATGINYSSYTVTFTTVDQTPPSSVTFSGRFNLSAASRPSIQAVVNSASLQPVASPGALISIIGSNLTRATFATSLDVSGSYPSITANTEVFFAAGSSGYHAPILYLSPGQINAIVPWQLAGRTDAQVLVGGQSPYGPNPFTLQLQDTSPAIFTADQSGTGQGVIVDATVYNSQSQPFPAGAAVQVFATGMGVWDPSVTGYVYIVPQPFTAKPVSVTIGGLPAKVLYAGTMGGSPGLFGVLQVNVVIPAGLSPGIQPVVLKVGNNDNSLQKVTMWVR